MKAIAVLLNKKKDFRYIKNIYKYTRANDLDPEKKIKNCLKTNKMNTKNTLMVILAAV